MVTDEPGNPWTWGASSAPDNPPPSYGIGAKDLTTSSCASATVSSSGAASIASAAPATVSSVAPLSGTNAPTGGSASTGSASIGSGSTTIPSTGIASTTSPSTESRGACPSQPSVGPAVVCGGHRVGPPVTLPPEKVLITEAQALAATARVRNAIGLDGAPTRVEGLSVVVDPLAGGRHTTGLASLFQLSSRATVVSARGSLSTGRDGALYPLRTARKAFDDLHAVALGAPCGAAGCPPGAAVAGAQLGLSRVALSGGAAALVPAWLFAVQGSPVPLAVVAVLDRFVTGPAPAPTKPGTQPPDDPAPEPGNPAPDPGGLPLPPPTEKPAVPTDRESFGFDRAYADADPTVVVIRYGDSGTCPSQTVRHDVVQDSARVVVTLTRTRMPNDQASPRCVGPCLCGSDSLLRWAVARSSTGQESSLCPSRPARRLSAEDRALLGSGRLRGRISPLEPA